MTQEFKNELAFNIFKNKYAINPYETWLERSKAIVDAVAGTNNGTTDAIMSKEDRDLLVQYINDKKFMPGGRYIYYAGRKARFYNNCYLLKLEEDSREAWAELVYRATSCLMTGGGIGYDISVARPSGKALSRTGGVSSGPIPLAHILNEVGRNVMQGGSRRSAMYASLNWQHGDSDKFLISKNWKDIGIGNTGLTIAQAKEADFNFHAPLDMTNISLNYDNAFLAELEKDNLPTTFINNCRQAMMNGEPGFSFNFGDKENETLRNAPVSGDTRVLTDGGYRDINSIVGQSVTVWTGEQWANTVFKHTGTTGTIEVVLSNGRSIKADPSHPFMQWTKNGKVRVEAQKLKVGDSIACDLPKQRGSIYPHSKDYGWGFLFGDGTLKNGRGEISFHVPEKEPCFNKALTDLGGYIRGQNNRGYFKADWNCRQPICSYEFMAGWFDADGCYTRGLLRLSSTDKEALLTASEYFDTIGIKTTVREDGKGGYCGTTMYTLTVMKESHSRFAAIIPTIRINVKPDDSYRIHNHKVVEIRIGEYEKVYCCDVGVQEHSFMAEGVLISNCTEITSEDDSDVCNLGSINIAAIDTLDDFKSVVRVASKFLVCGTIRADLPYAKVKEVRRKNRRLGLGLMGMHEWLLRRGYTYGVNSELESWLKVYESESERSANKHCDRLYLSRPKGYRAVAPTGTISILASTTSGIEPIFATAYKRRYITDGTKYKSEFVVDSTAEHLINQGIEPDKIESSLDLANDYERRIKFQFDVQKYVDHAISSTINLPAWGSENNNEEKVESFAKTIAKYAHGIRGLTMYPDGSRGGQPITAVSYEEASKKRGVVYEDNSDEQCMSGVCAI